MTAVPPFGTSLASAFSPAAMGGRPLGQPGGSPGPTDLQSLLAALAQQLAGHGGGGMASAPRGGQPPMLTPPNLSGAGQGIQDLSQMVQRLRSLIGNRTPPLATMPAGPGLATGDFTPGGVF